MSESPLIVLWVIKKEHYTPLKQLENKSPTRIDQFSSVLTKMENNYRLDQIDLCFWELESGRNFRAGLLVGGGGGGIEEKRKTMAV